MDIKKLNEELEDILNQYNLEQIQKDILQKMPNWKGQYWPQDKILEISNEYGMLFAITNDEGIYEVVTFKDFNDESTKLEETLDSIGDHEEESQALIDIINDMTNKLIEE